ncbi:MAG: SMC family ATPase [Dorea sp.]|nr:SMC family ATPase [Dorea sp.]
MRPHKLIMKSFGPFVNETTVDFDAMGNEIYLISGATGAGKTTIFDAMIYALYGTASGSARGMIGIESLHSDLATDGKYKEPMFVSFQFSNGGKTYTVERTLSWGKTGKSSTILKESSLSENGSVIATGKGKEISDDVSKRVTELLGLDANQFKNIILLAQGEFQKFLTSGSDKRGEILGKLYDNRQHKDFQLRLKVTYDALSARIRELVQNGKRELGEFQFAADADTLKEELHFDTPDLSAKLEAIIRDMEAQYQLLSEELTSKNQALSDLRAKKIIGDDQKTQLNTLKQAEEELKELDKKEDVIEDLKKKLDKAVSAEKVLSFESAREKASSDLDTTLRSIATLERQICDLKRDAATLTDQLNQVKEINTPEIDLKKTQKTSIENILNLYEELTGSKTAYKERAKELKAAREKETRLSGSLKKSKESLEEVDANLLELKDAGDAAVENAERIHGDLSKKQKALEQLGTELGVLASLERRWNTAQKNLLRETRNFNIASDHHRDLNTAFIAGQAGILADAMRTELESKEFVVCPVCNCVHSKADADTFAIRQEHTPSKEEVDAAWDAVTLAKDALNLANENYNQMNGNYLSKKEAVIKASEELLQIQEWNQALLENVLASAKSACKEQLLTAKKAQDKAIADKKRKEEQALEKKKLEASIHDLESKLEQAKKDLTDSMVSESKAKQEVAEKEARLKGYPATEKSARSQIQKIESEISKLKSAIEEAADELTNCTQGLASMEGAYQEKLGLREQQTKNLEAADSAFTAALSEYHFSDITAYHQALSPDGSLMNQKQITLWMKQKQEAIRSYEKNQSQLKTRIQTIQSSLEGKEIIQLEVVEAQIASLSPEVTSLSNREKTFSLTIGNNKKCLKKLAEIKADYIKTERAINKVKPLYDVANGNYKFYIYVLSDFFKQILDQANIHLNIMTDGEYSLVHKVSGDGRTSIGLDLSIYNNLTDVERNTATLSGGQLFEASLALALGLSDVAQMQSTSKIQVDSMFIDEGFGSLDKTRLSKALSVLNGLSAGKRQIGIISHVAQLEEQITKKIHVYRTEKGSYIEIESDIN